MVTAAEAVQVRDSKQVDGPIVSVSPGARVGFAGLAARQAD